MSKSQLTCEKCESPIGDGECREVDGDLYCMECAAVLYTIEYDNMYDPVPVLVTPKNEGEHDMYFDWEEAVDAAISHKRIDVEDYMNRMETLRNDPPKPPKGKKSTKPKLKVVK